MELQWHYNPWEKLLFLFSWISFFIYVTFYGFWSKLWSCFGKCRLCPLFQLYFWLVFQNLVYGVVPYARLKPFCRQPMCAARHDVTSRLNCKTLLVAWIFPQPRSWVVVICILSPLLAFKKCLPKPQWAAGMWLLLSVGAGACFLLPQVLGWWCWHSPGSVGAWW